MALGDNIRRYREKAGYTQKSLADILFTSPQTISKWENNVTEPSIDTLAKICKTLNCSIEEIVSGKRVEEQAEQPTVVGQHVCCFECGKILTNKTGKNPKIRTDINGEKHTAFMCNECLEKHKDLDQKKYDLGHPKSQEKVEKKRKEKRKK